MSIVESYLNKPPKSKEINWRSYGPELDIRWDSYYIHEKNPNYIHKERKWVRLINIYNDYPQQLRLPFGYLGFSPDGTFFERAVGYVPIISFFGAYNEFFHGCNIIFNKAIANDNVISRSRKFRDSSDRLFLNHVVYRANLNLTQRSVLVAIGVGMIFRSLVNCLQIGIVFFPFDFVFDQLFPWNEHEWATNKRSDFELSK